MAAANDDGTTYVALGRHVATATRRDAAGTTALRRHVRALIRGQRPPGGHLFARLAPSPSRSVRRALRSAYRALRGRCPAGLRAKTLRRAVRALVPGGAELPLVVARRHGERWSWFVRDPATRRWHASSSSNRETTASHHRGEPGRREAVQRQLDDLWRVAHQMVEGAVRGDRRRHREVLEGMVRRMFDTAW